LNLIASTSNGGAKSTKAFLFYAYDKVTNQYKRIESQHTELMRAGICISPPRLAARSLSVTMRWIGNSYTTRREKNPALNLSELGRLIPFVNEMNCVVLILAFHCDNFRNNEIP